ncbi:MAG: UDP-2,3-diacylglucosamine hydrolase [Bacteroides sp. SM23_62]|nr:MAG: UDP-2,3-diacylglucosamine hydrolase [Bacteroides sp. SM23_62]
MAEQKKIFFISDLHLGMYPQKESLEREKKVVSWLDGVYREASEIYLLGDIFDYWFEYKKVVPRGFTRFLGKVAEITDTGVTVNLFTGNHDVWVFDYLPHEIGVNVYHYPITREYGGKKFLIAHGDGLGPGQTGYKILKGIFTSRILQWMYGHLLHPNFATGLAHRWSKKSRLDKGVTTEWLGEDREYLVRYAREKLEQEHFDYFVFGHRHLPRALDLNEQSKLFYLGDWIENFTYAVFNGEKLELKHYN